MKVEFKPRTFRIENVAEKKENQLVCPVCGSTNIQYDPKRGEYICMDCGAVVMADIPVDNGERQDFTKKFGARVGPPIDRNESISHSRTEIGTEMKNVSNFMRRRISSLKRTNYYASQTSKDRNWKTAMQILDRTVEQIGVRNPAIINRTKKLYREVLKKGINRGRSIEKTVLACILLASKLENYPISIDEIAKASGVKKRDINSIYKKIKNELGITQQSIELSISSYIDKIITNYYNHSTKFRKEATEIFTPEIVLLSKKIAEEAYSLGIASGKKRISIAAAALYTAIEAFGKNVPQSHISTVSNVTEVTIRNRSRDIKKKIDIESLKKETIAELYGDEDG